MEITLDRASKFYEPGEKVTGTISFKDCKWDQTKKDLKIKAEAYMDTVSQIRGNQGRPSLRDPNGSDGRIFFMTKKFESIEIQGNAKTRKFEFVLESTVDGEKLIDAYVGVEFSVVYKITATCQTK